MSESKVPHDDIPFFESKAARYHRCDMRAMPDLDVEAFEQSEREMRDLGLSHFGDMLCSVAPDLVVRCYGCADTSFYGMHIQEPAGDPYDEFYTEFDDSSSLTTTTNPLADNLPRFLAYRESLPGLTASDLQRKHLAAIKEHERVHRTGATMAEPKLEGLAKAIDRFLQRTTSRGFEANEPS